MADSAEQAVPSGGTAASERAHTLRMTLVVIALAAGFAFVPRATQSCGKATGTEEAPDFTASVVANPLDPTQKTITMSALRGHPVVLDFWATWCGPCQAEAPIVNGIAQRFKDKGLVVIGVNTSDEEGLAARYAVKKGLSLPDRLRRGQRDREQVQASTTCRRSSSSRRTGKMVAVRHGVTSDADLERLVRQVL